MYLDSPLVLVGSLFWSSWNPIQQVYFIYKNDILIFHCHRAKYPDGIPVDFTGCTKLRNEIETQRTKRNETKRNILKCETQRNILKCKSKRKYTKLQ